MKRFFSKIRNIYTVNKKILIFLGIITIIAIAAGSFLSTILSSEDKELVDNYLVNFFTGVRDNNFNYFNILKNGLITNILMVTFIWLLGISVIGLPIIIVLYFTKCFIFGFSIASIISYFKFKGSLYAFVYVFPHHLLNIVILIYLIVYAMACSIKVFNAVIKKQSLDFKVIMGKYRMILVTTIIAITITTLYETFIMPSILKFVFGFLKF